MRMLYVCGRFRFTREMEELEGGLTEEKIEYLISKKEDCCGILGCLGKIDQADCVYVVDPGAMSGEACVLTLDMPMQKTNRFTPCIQ